VLVSVAFGGTKRDLGKSAADLAAAFLPVGVCLAPACLGTSGDELAPKLNRKLGLGDAAA